MVIAAITGHRPEKIEDPEWVGEALGSTFLRLGISHVIQGMASGVDLWSAFIAFGLGIPYTAARPWAGHKPRKDDQELYDFVLRYAAEVVDVDPSIEFPGKWVYQKRNKWIVDRGNFVISVWDGEPKGGTWNAVNYAQKLGVEVFNCNPKERVCGFLASPV